MGKIGKAPEAVLFAGLIYNKKIKNDIGRILRPLGILDKFSPEVSFDAFSNYYEREMGKDLLRQWVSFDRIIRPDEIVEIKLKSNKIEEKISTADRRIINIDPGYITLSNLVLATTKNYSHRIYAGRGIFEEVTLIYRKAEGFAPLEWTYPDYRTDEARKFFEEVREKLKHTRE